MKLLLVSLFAVFACISSSSALADPPKKAPPTESELLSAALALTDTSNPHVANLLLPQGGDSFELILQIFPDANKAPDNRTICMNCFQRLARTSPVPAACSSTEAVTQLLECAETCSRGGAIIEREALTSLALSCLSPQISMLPGQM